MVDHGTKGSTICLRSPEKMKRMMKRRKKRIKMKEGKGMDKNSEKIESKIFTL